MDELRRRRNYTKFGDGYTGLLLDEITNECRVFLKRGDGDVRIVYTDTDGEITADLGNSIAEYLRAAMRHGFVDNWPDYEDGDTSSTVAAVDRFRRSVRS